MHLCYTCKHDFPTCKNTKIKWGIDVNPEARGAEADKVLECDGYENDPVKSFDSGQFGVGA